MFPVVFSVGCFHFCISFSPRFLHVLAHHVLFWLTLHLQSPGRLPEPFDVSSKTLCRILALNGTALGASEDR